MDFLRRQGILVKIIPGTTDQSSFQNRFFSPPCYISFHYSKSVWGISCTFFCSHGKDHVMELLIKICQSCHDKHFVLHTEFMRGNHIIGKKRRTVLVSL